jgi:hypothetical protein
LGFSWTLVFDTGGAVGSLGILQHTVTLDTQPVIDEEQVYERGPDKDGVYQG